MNLQVNDILSNPALLKEISEETIQKWIQQYPYVSLFHLYALKNKENYQEKDLHKTAFYFNNREKLYYLLNEKRVEFNQLPAIEKPAVVSELNNLIPEVRDAIQAETNANQLIETEINSAEKDKTESISTIPFTETSNFENIKEHLELPVSANEINTEKEEEVQEETFTPIIKTEVKPLSVAEQIMLEIEQLKAARNLEESHPVIEKDLIKEEINPKTEDIKENSTILESVGEKELILEIQEEPLEETKEISDAVIDIHTEVKTNEASGILEDLKVANELTVENTLKPLSIQDEVITRIQKIKEERAKKLLETDLNIQIEEKTEREISPVEMDENIPEDSDRFAGMFPEPLLVKVDTAELKAEKATVTLEQIQEEVIIPITSVNIEDKTIIREIIEEDLKEQQEQFGHSPLISQKSDLFIPNVEEDVIEEHIIPEIITDKETPVEMVSHKLQVVHEQSIEDEIPAQKLDEAVIKEPHTFVEWLKLLDGNLQIQTADTMLEPENWIEIPRYEVEQTLANKKEIQKEEQKLFEPNFEEGEVDLFNEIDEEVSKVATDSVSFKQDMMTETLAKIYQKQGKTDKALEIYNTLRLKFPEKSTYFASLIKKLEKGK